MKKTLNKAIVTGALVVALVGGSAVAANATTVAAGGGTHSYSVDLGYNYSSYYHGSYYHRATAFNNGGGFQRAYAEAGYWARASISAAVSGNQAAWYHNYGSRNI